MKISVIVLCFSIIALCNALPQQKREECDPNAACITLYAPVCGSDGVTYSNSCLLNNAVCENPSLTKTHDGEC